VISGPVSRKSSVDLVAKSLVFDAILERESGGASVKDSELRGAVRVREVFARVGNGDAEGVADLYADDAVIQYSSHERVQGREAIRAFYQTQIDTIRPQPEVESVFEQPPRYVAIVNVPTTDGQRRALDLFEVDERGVRRLEIFAW
jgi:SnoaL-like domain